MDINFVHDARIAQTASFKVAENPYEPGHYGVVDCAFMEVIYAGFDLEDVIQECVRQNRAWDEFLDEFLG